MYCMYVDSLDSEYDVFRILAYILNYRCIFWEYTSFEYKERISGSHRNSRRLSFTGPFLLKWMFMAYLIWTWLSDIAVYIIPLSNILTMTIYNGNDAIFQMSFRYFAYIFHVRNFILSEMSSGGGYNCRLVFIRVKTKSKTKTRCIKLDTHQEHEHEINCDIQRNY